MWLFDTNCISEYRKIPLGKANRYFMQWQSTVPLATVYISSITIMELRLGILLLKRKDPRQAQVLENWFNHKILPNFTHRILPIDGDTAMICAELHVPNPRPERDAMIAASAIQHGMTLVTRNVRDFVGLTVPIINPFDDTLVP